jgi:hypothetical protein
MASWSLTPATAGHNAVRVQHTNAEPLETRNVVDELMRLFGAGKQMAVSNVGTRNADGTGTVTITVTAT